MLLTAAVAPAAPVAPAPAAAAAAAAAAAKSYCFIVLLWLHAINGVLVRGFYCTSTYAYVSYRIYFYLHLQLILRCHVVYIVP